MIFMIISPVTIDNKIVKTMQMLDILYLRRFCAINSVVSNKEFSIS